MVQIRSFNKVWKICHQINILDDELLQVLRSTHESGRSRLVNIKKDNNITILQPADGMKCSRATV